MRERVTALRGRSCFAHSLSPAAESHRVRRHGLRCKLDKKSGLQRGAILWFVASGLSLVAALLNYSGEGEIKWTLLAATFFMAAMGFSSLRRSRPDGS